MPAAKRVVVVMAAMGLLVAACAAPEAVDGPAPPPTNAIVSTPTTIRPIAPISGPVDVPNVRLSSGEVVGLFESFDHGNFANPTAVDNPYLPLRPGTRMVYEGFTEEDGERASARFVSIVTDLVKVIDGVPSVVVWDVDYSDGELAETELAFFAQDDDGNVWRMGEYPEEWEEGEFIEAPSWMAGVRDARAGIAMKADPTAGSGSYSQGWGPAVEFTDRAMVDSVGSVACVQVDCFQDVLVTDEFNDDEPGFHQLKYYVAGLGNIQVGWRGNDSSIEEMELVEITQLTPQELVEARTAALILEERAYVLSPDVYRWTERAQVPDYQ